jgi:hypothetical protein
MVIKIVEQVNDEELLQSLWELYSDAFKDLNSLAVQRHLMYRNEFDEVMRDQRVQKYLCLDDDGTLYGLSTYTNDLAAVPLIAPEYFERHWPDHYAARKIWYIGFVAVDPRVGAGVTPSRSWSKRCTSSRRPRTVSSVSTSASTTTTCET